jgi:signal transduction histidine kinase
MANAQKDQGGASNDEPVAEWLVVLNANGVVDALEGDAPSDWVGQSLVDIPGTPGIVRRAAAELVHGPAKSHVRRRRVRCVDDEKVIDVEILLVEALPLRRAPTPVHALTMRTLDLFATQAKSNRIDLTVTQAEGVPATIVVDSEKLAWALSTLVVNGLRFAREHVTVHVSTDAETEEVLFAVTDDGPGVPEHKLEWLFVRDPKSGQASGLALPMVRDVMAAHRGSVTVQRKPTQGTTFTLRLPRAN